MQIENHGKIHPMLNTEKQPLITERPTCQKVYQAALSLGLTPLQANLVAGRIDADALDHGNMADEIQKIVFPKLQYIQPPTTLKNASHAAKLIADAIQSDGKIVLATDYDTDGVTSAWVATQALVKYFGVAPERIEHLIGERKEGYGITDEMVQRILSLTDPVDLVISADQGSSDEPRIAQLAAQGIKVCVTDHHQMAIEGPPKSAVCTVNPQQQGCDYDKTVAGCFVIFLVMSQTRAELIQRQAIPADTPSLKELAQNIALGTVADSVSLKSVNNRAIVQAGLAIINQLKHPCWRAMKQLNNNQHQPFTADYLAFQVATRINAASRVSDVTSAFHFLNAGDLYEAQHHLNQLDEDNLNRRQQQEDMLQQAQAYAETIFHDQKYTLCIKMTGNAGIQGIIASRIGEYYGRPTIAMTELEGGLLAGSARGIINNIDLRSAFQWMSEQDSELFRSMGGHKGAAGCMIPLEKFEYFSELFEKAIAIQLQGQVPVPQIETDGQLSGRDLTPELIQDLNVLEPYGREWPKPIFYGHFKVLEMRLVGQTQTHLSLKLLSEDRRRLSAIQFNARPDAQTDLTIKPHDTVIAVYEPSLNNFHGRISVQLKISHLIPKPH